MLEPLPGRSVARFMLPLADVMTVLFSLFLLLPHLEQRGGRSAGAAKTGGIWTPEEQFQARDELARHRRLAELPTGARLHVIVMMIDEETGHLLLHEGARTVSIKNVEELKAIVVGHGTLFPAEKRLLYIVQIPPVPPGRLQRRHPSESDFQNYAEWFAACRVEYQVSGLSETVSGPR
jgi:hypothetical protein